MSLGEHVLPTLFGALLAHQLGIPIPAFPLLIWAGAVSYGNPLQVAQAFVIATLAGVVGDLPWYFAGRRYGYRILKLVCKVTLSPDSCVRQTESAFDRRGPSMLVVSRFLPGIETVAPPLAGALALPVGRFILYDAAGSALRAAGGLALGLVFHGEVGWLLDRLTALGTNAVLLLGVLLGGYVAWRFAQRWRFLRSLRTARISVHELNDMMSRGEDPVVLDVRTAAHRRLDGRQIPGAHPVDLDALESTLERVPRDGEVVVYCACPNEATAAKVALKLRARGFRRVRPLGGGIDAWMSAGLAVERIARP
ncbi:MAG TPA: DedA family protein/thiosulfate sulfurtransferase GlpE [Burkholderiales bacterium]|nr:DedA family protein/thiosulfate sulfurtransferase GlpE [Burkholderiales bacterium]